MRICVNSVYAREDSQGPNTELYSQKLLYHLFENKVCLLYKQLKSGSKKARHDKKFALIIIHIFCLMLMKLGENN